MTHSTELSDWDRTQGIRPISISIAQACALSGFGPTSIWAFIRDGRLKPVRIPGIRRTMVDYQSLLALLRPKTGASPQPQYRRRGRPRKQAA